MKYVAYIRTNDRAALETFKTKVQELVSSARIVAEYVEDVHPPDRRQRTRAIETALKENARLLIARIDRLSDGAYLFQLRTSSVSAFIRNEPGDFLHVGTLRP